MAELLANAPVSEALQNNIHYQVRQESIFLNPEQHQHYLTHGWCKIENVVTKGEIKSFMDAYNDICHLEGFALGNQFLNTGCLPQPEIRDKTSEVINLNVQTILPRMFNMDIVASHTGGSFVIKPPHEESDLAVHQDSAFINEEKEYCLFMWVPFCDVTEANGPISVLSGSHLWGNTQRGFSTPWNLQKHAPLLEQHMQQVLANVGDVLLFDPALIHASKPNLSNETRHAITITVARKNPALIYFYHDNTMPADVIDRYDVDEDFFRTYDFASRPDESKWKKTTLPYKSFDLSTAEVLELIEKYKPE
jgi:hypothetical protein